MELRNKNWRRENKEKGKRNLHKECEKVLWDFHLKRWANTFGKLQYFYMRKHYHITATQIKVNLKISPPHSAAPFSHAWFSWSALAFLSYTTHSRQQLLEKLIFILSHCLPSILSWHQRWLMAVVECAVLSRKEACTDLSVSGSPASARPGGWCRIAVSDVRNEQAVFPPGWLFDLEFAERKQQQFTVFYWQHSWENETSSHI